MACRRQSKTNQSDSILFDKLYKLSGENEISADEKFAYFQSEPFIEEFGDWISAYELSDSSFYDRVEDNGEPKLFYNELTQTNYFIDKFGEQIPYPLVKGGLRTVFDYKQLNRISSLIALDYFISNTKYNFNNIDFEQEGDQVERLPNLKKFIQNKINTKIADLENSEDYFNAMSLEESLDYIDEWVTRVDNFYKKIGIKRNDNVEDSESLDMVEQTTKDPAYNMASFERDTKNAVSTNVKLRLALLKDEFNIDPIWNEPTFVSFDDIYSTLLKALSNQVVTEVNGELEDIFEIYKDEIVKLSRKKPFFKELLSFLNDPSFTENNKNEFVQAFNLHKNNFLISELKQGTVTKDGETEATKYFKHTVQGVSNSGDRSARVFAQWGNNFKSKFLNEDNSIKEDTKETLKDLSKSVLELKGNLNENISENDFNNVVNKYISLLDKLGVETTQEGFIHYLEDEGNNVFDIKKQSSKLSTTITNTSLAIKNVIKISDTDKVEENFVNPFKDQSIFRRIANAEAFFMSEGSDASIYSGGKSKWLYSYPSYLSTKILQWKKDPSILEALYNKSAYNQGSYLMKWLLGLEQPRVDRESVMRDRIEKFDVGIFNVFQEERGESSSANEISFNDYFTDHVNKVLSNGYVRTTTPADKTTDYQLNTGLFVKSFGGFKGGNIQVNFETKEIFFEYFNSEFNRMKEAYQELLAFKTQPEKLTVHYHFKKGKNIFDKEGNILTANLGNAFKSQYFPELSPTSKSNDPLVVQIKQLIYSADFAKSFKGDLDLRDNPKSRIGDNIFEIKPLIDEYINQELVKGIIETTDIFRKQNIIKYNDVGKTVNNLVSSGIYNKYVTDYNTIFGETGVISALISDFYINSLIQNIEYSKMFSGDVAFYKDMVDYKKRIPATYTDGLQLRLKLGEETFNVASINAIEIESPFLLQLREMVGDDIAGKYENINSTDAQAWITPKRWKFLVERLGKWTSTHTTLYSKMISDNNEAYTQEELKIAAQPLKGVYFDLNGKVPTYLKYSQAVLTKSLVNGTPLQRMYNQMVKQKVDELITLDGYKVGSPTTTTMHDSKGNILDEFSFNVVPLKNSGWKLQQDLPTKTFKDTEVGSQIQKNIFGGLKFNRNERFDLAEGTVDGEYIIQQLTDITKALSDKGMESLTKEFNIDRNGKIKNVRGFYNSLINELERRGGSTNVINALRKEIPLYGIPQAGNKIINVFSSIVTNRLLKIKTNGGSFIQMSNFGLSKTEGNSKGVIWSPDADNTTNEPYLYVDSEGKTKVKPAGILLSGSFIAKYIPNYRDYTAEELFISYQDGAPIIDSRISQSLIGYRIPNQGLASNDALRIVGILPEENGDTVVAYTGITTKTGSDFDIDKMYLMMPSYNYNQETGRLEYVEYNNEIAPFENSEKALQNRLIELYKGVLTNTEVIKDVMKPVDIDFIKNEIVSLYPTTEQGSLFHFNSFNDINLLYDFRGGKAGVGQEANAVVDINRLGELTLNNKYIGWGYEKNGETLLDEEYSQTLSKADLEYYLSVMKDADVNEISKVRIADSLTAILNAFVDIAKDPYITRGNWVTSTTNVGNLLIRSGMHPLYVTNFMAQPIIKDYINYQASIESLIGNETGDMKFKFKKNIAIDRLNLENERFPELKVPITTWYEKLVRNKEIPVKEFNKMLTPESASKFFRIKNPTDEQVKMLTAVANTLKREHSAAFEPSTTTLEDKSLQEFREQVTGKPNSEFQLAVLNKFFELQDLSKNVRENIDVSKTDTSGPKNISTLYGVANLRSHIKSKEDANMEGALKGFESKLDNTVLGAYYNNRITKIIDLVDANPELFPQGQRKVQEMFNEVSFALYGTPAFNEDLMTALESEYYSYNLANFFDLTNDETKDLLNNLPQRFIDFRKANRGKYLIIDELEIKQGLKKTVKNFIGLNNRKKSSDFEDAFSDSWRDLRNDNPDLANDLIKYSYLTSGFKVNPNQFFTYIPNEFFVENNIKQFINDFVNTDQEDFIDKFFLNNSDNHKFVPKVFESVIIATEFNISKDGQQLPKYDSGFIIDTEANSNKYFVKLGENIYKLQGFNNYGDSIYTRVQPLGYKYSGNLVVEYGKEFTSEIFKDRNVELNEQIIDELKNQVTHGRNEFINSELERNSDVIDKINTNTVEGLWLEYEQRILEKHPNATIEDLYNLEADKGLKGLSEYLKECY